MGMLLGIIFYFLVGQGLLAVATTKSTPESLGEAGLAGIGALAGLFSKEAIEKLRELFNTLFSTRKSVEESVRGDVEKSLLDSMAPELSEKVQPYLSAAGKPNPAHASD